jgi:hypothetical protein
MTITAVHDPTLGAFATVIAAENISNVDYQLVKLAVGVIGSTEAIPGGSEFGLVVAVSCMPSVRGIVQVSVLSR